MVTLVYVCNHTQETSVPVITIKELPNTAAAQKVGEWLKSTCGGEFAIFDAVGNKR